MFYITTKLSPYYHQMTMEDLISSDFVMPQMISNNETSTKTYEVNVISDRFLRQYNIRGLINVLRTFNEQNKAIMETDRHNLYKSFKIPKKSGGFRQIDAPEPELKTALDNLKTIFETSFNALYHTSAFAYIKGRSTIDCIKRHQRNESRWFAKEDLHNFFGSTTLEFTLRMLSMIFPFSEVLKDKEGSEELKKALELGFLDGGLPQGTPLSPTLTNIIMIPMDYVINKRLKSQKEHRYIYTRYADDFIVSSKWSFNSNEVRDIINNVFEEFGAPYRLNEKKSRYGSNAGSNWNLGLMLNKDNQITVGYKNKKYLKAALCSYAQDKVNGIPWELDDIRTLEGKRSYYQYVEGDVIKEIVSKIGNKFGIDIELEIKNDLNVELKAI